MKQKRIVGLDVFRGWAILFMIMYHFVYDLNLFHILTFDMNHNLFSLLVRYSIMSMFIISVGMSLSLAHKKFIHWGKLRKRTFILFLAASIVSIATYVEFPHSWVYFGILHFIVFSTFLALPFLGYPKLTALIIIVILLGHLTGTLHMHSLFSIVQPILNLPPFISQDIVRLVPWFAVLLIGTLMVHYRLHERIFTQSFFETQFSINKTLEFMGKNSLLIYLLHQPILFFGFDSYVKLFSK